MLETKQERKDFLEYAFYVSMAVLFLAMMGYSVGWVNIFKAAVGLLGFSSVGILIGKWVKKGK